MLTQLLGQRVARLVASLVFGALLVVFNVTETLAAPLEGQGGGSSQSDNGLTLILVLALVVVVAGAGIGLMFSRRKK